jgi:hypothetical protein
MRAGWASRSRSHEPLRKSSLPGPSKVIDRDTGQAKYLDTLSGRIRLAMIADNSATSIEDCVRANVKRGTTLLTDGHASYPGLTGYRHDPRVVGKMAGHVQYLSPSTFDMPRACGRLSLCQLR